LEQTIEEWENTNELFASQLRQRDGIAPRQFERKEDDIASRVVNILVSEFEECGQAGFRPFCTGE
jgi:hypothetical protein